MVSLLKKKHSKFILIVACEQGLFWGLAHKQRSHESVQRSRHRAVTLSRLRRSCARPQNRACSQVILMVATRATKSTNLRLFPCFRHLVQLNASAGSHGILSSPGYPGYYPPHPLSQTFVFETRQKQVSFVQFASRVTLTL